MSFKSQLTEDLKQAMRDKDTTRVSVIRYLLSEIRNVEIDEGDLDTADVHKIISRQVKQMQEAIADYKQAGRDELVAQEQEKVAILKEYLPEQLSDEELSSIVDDVLTQTEEKNMGQVIGAVMKRTTGQAEGNRVAKMVKEKLQ